MTHSNQGFQVGDLAEYADGHYLILSRHQVNLDVGIYTVLHIKDARAQVRDRKKFEVFSFLPLTHFAAVRVISPDDNDDDFS